jgi:hypothetical protein
MRLLSLPALLLTPLTRHVADAARRFLDDNMERLSGSSHRNSRPAVPVACVHGTEPCDRQRLDTSTRPPDIHLCEGFVDEKISGNDQKPDGILKSGALLTGMSN